MEAILQTEARRFIREIATSLGQSEQPLIDEMKKERLQIHLVDATEPTEETFICRAYTQEKNMMIICGAPVIYGTSFCPLHRSSETKKPPEGLQILRRLYTEEGSIYFYNELTRNVYTTAMEFCGILSRGEPPVLRLFEIEVEEKKAGE